MESVYFTQRYKIQIWKYTVFDSNTTKYVLPRLYWAKLLENAALLAVLYMKNVLKMSVLTKFH